LILAIEITNPTISPPAVAIAQPDGTPLAKELLAHAKHEEDLIAAIDRVLNRAGKTRHELSLIACAVGPGGFTSCRIATAAAASIALGLNLRAVAVPSSLVAFVHALGTNQLSAQSFPVAVCLASKQDSTFATLFAADCCALPHASSSTPHALDARAVQAALEGAKAMNAADFSSLCPRTILSDAHLPQGIKHYCDEHQISILSPSLCPSIVAAIASESSLARPVSPEQLVPIYPREPEAVRLWALRTPAS
jgi:tRNA threonylcarbamoyl adenosine modification protein YeaZ